MELYGMEEEYGIVDIKVLCGNLQDNNHVTFYTLCQFAKFYQEIE